MSIVAKGVEAVEALTWLQAATRIRQALGYSFSKPLFLAISSTPAASTRTLWSATPPNTASASPT